VEFSVRRATINDAEAIRRIYNIEVTTSTVTFDMVPRTLEEQQAWLIDRRGAHAVLVAEADGEIWGFGSLSPFRERAAYNTTVEDSVYVDRARQGQGVGKGLLAALVDTATSHGFHSVVARIVGGHDASIALHAALGFDHVGVEKEVGRKHRKWLDVVIMQRMV